MSTISPMQWHDLVSPDAALHRRKTEKAVRTNAVISRKNLKYCPEARPSPMISSAITTKRAAKEQRSKPAKPNENIYNSKLSIEESFAIDESMNNTPNKIPAIFLRLLIIVYTIYCGKFRHIDVNDFTLDVLDLEL